MFFGAYVYSIRKVILEIGDKRRQKLDDWRSSQLAHLEELRKMCDEYALIVRLRANLWEHDGATPGPLLSMGHDLPVIHEDPSIKHSKDAIDRLAKWIGNVSSEERLQEINAAIFAILGYLVAP